MTAYTFEPEDNSRLFLTIFCIGVPGIEVANHLRNLGIRDVNLVITHTDRAQLMGSPVDTKWWYEPGLDTDVTDELRYLIGTNPLTVVVVDLQRADDRELAEKAVSILVERNAFYIVALPTPDPADELALASLTYLQQQPGSLLLSQPANANPAALISSLTYSVHNICQFCDILYTDDLPAIRMLMPLPGRLVIGTSWTTGDNRVYDAFSDVNRYLHAQPFDCARASQLYVQIGASDGQPVKEDETTHLMALVADLTNTEPNRCTGIRIIDNSLDDRLQLTLLLWYPVEPGELVTV